MHEKHLDEFVRIAKKLIPRKKYIIVEVGARDCEETVAFDVLLPGSEIFAFECNPDTLPQCHLAIQGKKNIKLIEKAVTDNEGNITFYQINHEKTVTGHPSGKNPGASSIFEANEEYPLEKYSQNKIVVPTTTLKIFSGECDVDHVDLMWMDIQGAELLALKGAGDFLDKISLIHLETEFFPIYKKQPLFSELKTFLNSKGFRLYTFTNMGKFAGDAVFLNTRTVKKMWMLPEWLIYFYFKCKEIVTGKFRGGFIKLKIILKKYPVLRKGLIRLFAFSNRVKCLLTENKSKKEYYKKIEKIKKDKKIVIDLSFGGIGDCLIFSTLPRLLKETYDIDFYLSKKSMKVIRQEDIFKLCFDLNPYFKGLNDSLDVFKLKTFESEKSLYTFISDKDSNNLIEILEKQFGVKGRGRPEIYYKPNLLNEYKEKVLVDENSISGKRFGWEFKSNAFYTEALKNCINKDSIEYVNPKNQDLFTYIDMIYSCKYFIGTSSGGASISACFDKSFSVILPQNAMDGSIYQFVFKNSKGSYVS